MDIDEASHADDTASPNTDIAAAYDAVDRDALEPMPAWRAPVEEVQVVAHKPLSLMTKVALLRVAGIEDTVVLGDALGVSPAAVTAAETGLDYPMVVRRIRASAGLDTWRSHIEATVATGQLPSGEKAREGTQAGFLSQLFEREEPTKQNQAPAAPVIVIGEHLVERMAMAMGEMRQPIIDVTPRMTAPATDPELERRVAERIDGDE